MRVMVFGAQCHGLETEACSLYRSHDNKCELLVLLSAACNSAAEPNDTSDFCGECQLNVFLSRDCSILLLMFSRSQFSILHS